MIYEELSEKITEIEFEMKKIGYWSEVKPSDEDFQFKLPFALDTMPFEDWLQFVFIPSVRKKIEKKESLPEESNVGVAALRQYDYHSLVPEAHDLMRLLFEFDKILK